AADRPGERTGPDLPANAVAEGIRPGAVQPERIPLRGLKVMFHSCSTGGRRAFLRDAFCGFGSLAFASLLHEAERGDNPLAPKKPHRPDPKAKAVIFLFMAGGPSHLETFDPKPLLNQLNGQPRPAEFGEAKYQFIQKDARLLGSARKFQKYGESGLEVSDLLPNIAQCIDDLAVVRSCYGDPGVHSAAQYEL